MKYRQNLVSIKVVGSLVVLISASLLKNSLDLLVPQLSST